MEMIHSQPAHYRSYLVRMWQSSPQQPWRASAQSTATDEVHHFASIAHLVDFLSAQALTDEVPATNTPDERDNMA